MNSFDITVVLNLHNEARYLKRTLLSHEEAVRYARQFDISTELVVVLDNADEATRAMAEGYDYSVFDAVQIIHVRNGSLGLSRNDGVAVARGDYITLADGDDLISFDCLQKMYMTAFGGGKVVVLPEYCIGFGARNYIWRTYPGQYIGATALFDQHPYLSRIMVQRSAYDTKTYAENSNRTGYSYEDWHFNCECAADGYFFAVAKDTVLFYRQRHNSLMRLAGASAVRITPPSRYYEPNTFLKLAWSEMTGSRQLETPSPHFTRDEFVNASGMAEVIGAANKIDPMISLGILRYSEAASNLPRPSPAVRTYFEICRRLGGQSFTDVLLIPFMAPGGAEKYILSAIEGLRHLEPDARLLVLATQKGFKHGGQERLPADAMFIDLCDASLPELDSASIEFIVLRLLQHVPGVERVHLKNSEFVDSFLRKFSRYLKNLDMTYYYFCDPQFVVNGIWFTNGQSFDLVSETASDLTRVVSDHAANVEALSDLISAEVRAKSHALYTHCALPDVTAAKSSPSGRMIWASRIDSQKRPELLPRIAERLAERKVPVTIDIYGGAVLGGGGPELFDGYSNLAYRGPFSGPDDLGLHRYDALIYTAAFDGLPNIVLEAMAAGLPVVAPDVGGIGEAVSDETGYLVANDIDDDVLIERYVSAILAIYGNWSEAQRRGANARQLIAQRHSQAAFVQRTSEVFAIDKCAESLS